MIQVNMVVFYFIIINIIMVFINVFFMMFSLMSVEINNFEIVGLNEIINLISDIKHKNYLDVVNYINFEIIIKIQLFNRFTLIKITLKSEKIRKIAEKKIKKAIKKNKLKFNKNKNKNKKSNIIIKGIKQIFITVIIKMIKIEEIKLNCLIGLSRADVTSIVIGFFNCIISLVIALYFTKVSKDKIKIEKNAFKYKIYPIYSDKIEIKGSSVVKVSSKIY